VDWKESEKSDLRAKVASSWMKIRRSQRDQREPTGGELSFKA
jgi:hypothetical protein